MRIYLPTLTVFMGLAMSSIDSFSFLSSILNPREENLSYFSNKNSLKYIFALFLHISCVTKSTGVPSTSARREKSGHYFFAYSLFLSNLLKNNFERNTKPFWIFISNRDFRPFFKGNKRTGTMSANISGYQWCSLPLPPREVFV